MQIYCKVGENQNNQLLFGSFSKTARSYFALLILMFASVVR